jgi:hypothetical protein
VQLLIEHRHGDVEDQRGEDPALRRAGVGIPVLAEFGENTGLQERLHQRQHPLVLNPQPHPIKKSGV